MKIDLLDKYGIVHSGVDGLVGLAADDRVRLGGPVVIVVVSEEVLGAPAQLCQQRQQQQR